MHHIYKPERRNLEQDNSDFDGWTVFKDIRNHNFGPSLEWRMAQKKALIAYEVSFVDVQYIGYRKHCIP